MKKGYLLIFITILSISLIGCTNDGRVESEKPPQIEEENKSDSTDIADDSKDEVMEQENEDSIVYINNDYGFNFSLPSSWDGYTIVSQKWESNDGSQSGNIIIIRHPQWTEKSPRQDIPIMVFNHEQWDMIEKEELSIGAAPISPSMLGENSEYVFALPARYNFAFPTGFEEVEDILNGNPLDVNDNK